MKKNKYIILSFLLFIVILVGSFITNNYHSKNKNKFYLRVVYFVPDNIKSFIKKKIFVYDHIKNLEIELKNNNNRINNLIVDFENLLREAKINRIIFEKINDEIIILGKKKFLLTKFKTNFLNTSKNIDSAAKGTSYIDIYENNLFVVSATGITSAINYEQSLIENNKNLNFFTIKNNIRDIIKYEEFYIDSKYGIKDIKIIKDKIYISYTNQLKLDCYNISILVADINFEELIFTKFFEPKECVKKINDFTKFNPHHSGGRIESLNEKFLLVSFGDFKNFSLPQKNGSIFGKILSINKDTKEYKIISKGLRNPQGLYLDELNSLLLSTDHGPQGGDEINLQSINDKNIINFGWPVSSYGEHYGFKSKDEKNLLYKNAPLHKSHVKYGFYEPIKFFSPGIGISQIQKFNHMPPNKSYLVSSMGINPSEGGHSLHLINLNQSNKIIDHEYEGVGGRIRDLISKENGREYFLLIENGPILGHLKIID